MNCVEIRNPRDFLIEPLLRCPKTAGQLALLITSIVVLVLTLGVPHIVAAASYLCKGREVQIEPSMQLPKYVATQPSMARRPLSWPLRTIEDGNALHGEAKTGLFAGEIAFHVERGVSLNEQDRDFGNTPLLWAVANARNYFARELMNHPQNFNLLGCGNSALHLVVAKGYRDVSADGARLLVSNVELAQKLVDVGADVNLVGAHGFTPVQIAYLKRDVEMIKILYKGGADLEMTTKDGSSCRDLWDLDDATAESVLGTIGCPVLLDRSATTLPDLEGAPQTV